MGELHPSERFNAPGARSQAGEVPGDTRQRRLDPVLGPRGLIDECLLTIHPLVLGEGRRLFRSGFPLSQLTLTATKPTTTGVIAATYRFTSTGSLA